MTSATDGFDSVVDVGAGAAVGAGVVLLVVVGLSLAGSSEVCVVTAGATEAGAW